MAALVTQKDRVSGTFFAKSQPHEHAELESKELSTLMSSFDVKRLESYANNMLDYHVILDLLPTLAALYFKRRLIAPKAESDSTLNRPITERIVKLTSVQRAMLLALGLQRKTIEEAGEELSLQPNQVLAEFMKVIKKMCAVLQLVQRAAVVSDMPQFAKLSLDDDTTGGQLERMDEELEHAAREVRRELREQNRYDKEMADAGGGLDNEKKARQREFINSLDLSQ